MFYRKRAKKACSGCPCEIISFLRFLLQASGRVFVTSKWASFCYKQVGARASHFYSRIKLTCTLVLFNKIGVVDVTIVQYCLADLEISEAFNRRVAMETVPECWMLLNRSEGAYVSSASGEERCTVFTVCQIFMVQQTGSHGNLLFCGDVSNELVRKLFKN